MTVGQTAIASLLLVLGLAGCSASNSQPVSDAGLPRCGDGFKSTGPTCVPVFAYCKQNEVALPGGGCKRVGAPATCLTGWKPVTGGWCEPVLPAGKCSQGTMAVIGKTTCQPIRDCGSGKYGKIKVTARTIYVDRQYSKADANGSRDRPYQSIDEALSAATSGAHIAVAAGVYQEDLVINKRVTLEGRCPTMVTVKGYKTDHPGTIQVTSNGTRISGLTVTGSHRGVILYNATKVVVERCAITDNASFGLAVESRAEVTVRYSLVQGNHMAGVAVGGSSTITVDHCDIRGTKEKLFKKKPMAYGLYVNDGEISVLDSVISDNGPEAGLYIQEGKGKIIRSVVRGTRERPKDTVSTSAGVMIQLDSNVVIQDSLIAENRQNGILSTESTLTVEQSVIRDTRAGSARKDFGMGILSRTIMEHMGGKLTMRDSTLSGNAVMGVFAVGGVATLDRVVIRDTGAGHKSDNWAEGIFAVGTGKEWAIPELKLTVRSTLLEKNYGFGVKIKGKAHATMQGCTVRWTRPALVTKPETSIAGAIWVEDHDDLTGKTPRLTLKESLVERTEGFAMVVHAHGVVNMERTVIRDTAQFPSGPVPAISIASADSNPKPPDPTLTMKCSAVHNTTGVGLLVEGAKVQLTQSRIKDTTKSGGDGISVQQTRRPAEVGLDCTLVEGSARAGLIFFGGRGKVCRSIFRDGEFAIVLEKGANPIICNDNRYEKNTRTGVAFGQGLKPVQIWKPPMLKEPDPKL